MHDPMTVAFDIKSPIKRKSKSFPDGWRESLVTIWHVDPESNGSDDSCGYSVPHLSARQLERLKAFAWSESKYPYFLRAESKEWGGSRSEAEALYRGLLLNVAECIGIPMSFGAAAKQAALEIHKTDCTDHAGALCFLPGWHSNNKADRPEDREYSFFRTTIGIARWMLRDRRPWYRHPKWHIHHWRIQIHPLQNFKRWAFTRCNLCGGRFAYGESGLGTWSGNGPMWFRSEHLTHMSCGGAYAMPSAEPTP